MLGTCLILSRARQAKVSRADNATGAGGRAAGRRAEIASPRLEGDRCHCHAASSSIASFAVGPPVRARKTSSRHSDVLKLLGQAERRSQADRRSNRRHDRRRRSAHSGKRCAAEPDPRSTSSSTRRRRAIPCRSARRASGRWLSRCKRRET